MLGRRKLIGEMFTILMGSIVQMYTGSTVHWIWMATIYSVYVGMNVSSKWIQIKKNGSPEKINT